MRKFDYACFIRNAYERSAKCNIFFAFRIPSPEALLYVICSPVGDYFAGGVRPLRIAVETDQPRTTPQFGMVKSGANYGWPVITYGMGYMYTVVGKGTRQAGMEQPLYYYLPSLAISRILSGWGSASARSISSVTLPRSSAVFQVRGS